MIKKYLYTCLPVCLLMIGFSGCKDDDGVAPLPEAVPLIIEVSEKSFVMGETLTYTVKVDQTKAPGASANEDFDVYLSAKDGVNDVSGKVFKSFPKMLTFKKGETSMTLDLPIVDEGIESREKIYVNITAFIRGYQVNGSSQAILVADRHYTVASLKNNSDKMINEGDYFTVMTQVAVPVKSDTEINISVPEDQKEFYETLPPTTLTILAGEKVAEATVKTKRNPDKTRDEILILNFSTVSIINPIDNEKLEITMKDLDADLGDRLQDERWLYENPGIPFVSSINKSKVEAWYSNEISEVSVGAPHPKLASEGWKFYSAVEFHKIAGCFVNKGLTDLATGFGAHNTKMVEQDAAVNVDKFSTLTGDGFLRMWTMKIETVTTGAWGAKVPRPYGSSAFYAAKGKWAPGFVRILPGSRVETRARVKGNKKGFNMAIWLMGSSDTQNAWPKCGEADIMENPAGSNTDNQVWQSMHWGAPGEDHSNNSGRLSITNMNTWNIYWFEWVDETTIKFGINGKTTKTIHKDDSNAGGSLWPFTLAMNPNGLYYILTMGPKSNWALPNPPAGWDAGFSELNNYERDYKNEALPAMEVDWIRFYTQTPKDEYEQQSGDRADINAQKVTLY